MAKTSGKKPTGLIEPGTRAPTFTLHDQNEQKHQLTAMKGQWVVLYFYPKDNTPGCTKEACQFRDDAKAFQQRQAVVLGISPDNEKSHQKFANKYDLPFALLADHDAKVCQKYGVWRGKKLYGRAFMGVVRTTYIIDPKGVVARRFDKVKVTNHTQAVLEALDELASG